jgi:hypothetical protein
MTKVESVYSVVGTESLYKTDTLIFRGLTQEILEKKML